MSDRLLNLIKERYDLLLRTIQAIENRLDSMPEGTLNIKTTKNGEYYYLYKGKNQKYLGQKDIELIDLYFQKNYLKTSKTVARREADVLGKLIDKFPQTVIENIYEQLPEDRQKHIRPLIPDIDQYAQHWLSIPFTPKPFKKDAPVFRTLKGERVRSKSEVIIADRLYAKGIPYKYECPLQVGDEIIHPDFTILRLSDRKIVYHEHCGKMDDPDYTEDLVSRVKKYGHAGIYPGSSLSFSFESSKQPLDISWLDDFIEKNFR